MEQKNAYNGIKKEDLYDRNFVFDISVLVTKNLNLFSLERKILDIKNRETIYIFWEECVDQTFLQTHLPKRQLHVP